MNGLGICMFVALAFPVFFVVWVAVGFSIKRRLSCRFAAASVPAFILVFLCMAIYFDPHFVTEPPRVADVVGHYTLTAQTVTADGLSALGSEPCDIELRADGTFTARNLPPDELDSPGPNFFNTLLTGSGTWHIAVVGGGESLTTTATAFWGITLDSQTAKMHPISLAGWKPPYRLYVILGDPDCGDEMILERKESPRTNTVAIAIAFGLLMLGVLWLLSKVNGPVAAVLAFVLVVACQGLLRLFALAGLVLIIVDLAARRLPKTDKTLVPCANCGRLLAPSTAICPRCEHRATPDADGREDGDVPGD